MLLDGLRFVETHREKNMLLPRPATALAPQLKKTKVTVKAPNWKRRKKASDPPIRACITPLLEIQPALCLLEPFQIFKLLLNDGICDFIIRESEHYAAQYSKAIKFFKDKIYTFVAIILLPGYNARPRQRQ